MIIIIAKTVAAKVSTGIIISIETTVFISTELMVFVWILSINFIFQ